MCGYLPRCLLTVSRLLRPTLVAQTVGEARRSLGKELNVFWTHIGDASDIARNSRS